MRIYEHRDCRKREIWEFSSGNLQMMKIKKQFGENKERFKNKKNFDEDKKHFDKNEKSRDFMYWTIGSNLISDRRHTRKTPHVIEPFHLTTWWNFYIEMSLIKCCWISYLACIFFAFEVNILQKETNWLIFGVYVRNGACVISTRWLTVHN